MNKKLQITFWGGIGSVTGANFLLEGENTKLLVDCGLLQGATNAYEENKKPFPYDPKTIDFLFITHAHMDHIGRVCKLVKDGFRGVIYSTPETRELANVMLLDAIKIMDINPVRDREGSQRASISNGMNAKDPSQSGLSPESPLYSILDFNQAMLLWKTIPYHTQTKVNDEFSVYLKDAGHILGSSMYEFTFTPTLGVGEKVKVVFTGDSGNSPTPLLKNTEPITDADYLIVDSVYGDRNHESKDERDARFKQIVTETIQNRGALVIPAFSVERTQVILYELNNLVEDKKIPSVPIFLDSPLGQKVTDIYARDWRDFNSGVQSEIKSGDNIFSFPKLNITHGSRDSQAIVNTANPKIIIAGSGMSSGGRVIDHEIHFLPDPKSTILLMGYQALGTLGRRIQDFSSKAPALRSLGEAVEIKGSMIPVRARIEMISGYSSHKDSDSIVAMVSDTAKTVKKVFVVMGEPKSSIYLAQRLRDELEVDAVYPERGKVYRLE